MSLTNLIGILFFSHKGLRSAKSIINSDFSLVHTPTTLTLSSINFEARL